MRAIKRTLKNLAWLFNHPPTDMTSIKHEGLRCFKCGTDGGLFTIAAEWAVCWDCIKKAIERSLEEGK